jgi:hypothetical protein
LDDARNTEGTRDSRTARGDAALVAQYLHELSERHGEDREPGRADDAINKAD